MDKSAYPLSWPQGWKRSLSRTRAAFTNYKQRLTVANGVSRVVAELRRMGVASDNVVVSTNIKPRLDGFPSGSESMPKDPGVAVYWRKRHDATRCMAVDKYDRVADNLAAIAATLEAMRAIERHGGAQILERAFLGFAALPEKASQPWREVFGFEMEHPSLEAMEQRFRTLAKIHHPDSGGSREAFEKLVQARDAARLDLA